MHDANLTLVHNLCTRLFDSRVVTKVVMDLGSAVLVGGSVCHWQLSSIPESRPSPPTVSACPYPSDFTKTAILEGIMVER